MFDTTARLSGRDSSPGSDVYMRVFGVKGGVKRTDLISAGFRGGPTLGGDSYTAGITAYAPNRGILTFVTTRGGMSTLYYRNNNTGNIDDLAHAPSFDGQPSIFGVATGARANFVAFTSKHSGTFEARSATAAPGSRTDIFFKHLIDGEAL